MWLVVMLITTIPSLPCIGVSDAVFMVVFFFAAGSLGAALRRLSQAFPLGAHQAGLPDRLQGGECRIRDWLASRMYALCLKDTAKSYEFGRYIAQRDVVVGKLSKWRQVESDVAGKP